jgi:branched-chain amino acid transport system ATP-binding protein
MALLETHELIAFYGDFQALFGVSLNVEEGETIALIGANGAGKSTLLRAITGLLDCERDAIRFAGRGIGGEAPPSILDLGIAMVPEGRRLFSSLGVEENLRIGADRRRGSGHWNLETVYRLFPILKEKRRQSAETLSGGQQQMVAIGRALMSNPRLLLCDELSLGLAPVVVRGIYDTLPEIRRQGTALIIVEQDISRALSVADRVYCLMEGRVRLTGAPGELSHDDIHAAYFGTARDAVA